MEWSVIRPIRSFCGPSLFVELQYRSLYLCSTEKITIVILLNIPMIVRFVFCI